VFGAGTAGLRGFAYSHLVSTASSRAGMASTICCSHLPAETRVVDGEDPELLKSGGSLDPSQLAPDWVPVAMELN
jgi:hypothetical protein